MWIFLYETAHMAVFLVWPFVWLSRGVDPVVASHTRPSGHFTGLTKKQRLKQRVEGRKRQTRIQNCKTQEGEAWHFKAFLSVLNVAIAKSQRNSYTATKDADSSLVTVFATRRPVSDSPSPSDSSGPTNQRSLVCTQLNDFKYWYLTLTIL